MSGGSERFHAGKNRVMELERTTVLTSAHSLINNAGIWSGRANVRPDAGVEAFAKSLFEDVTEENFSRGEFPSIPFPGKDPPRAE